MGFYIRHKNYLAINTSFASLFAYFFFSPTRKQYHTALSHRSHCNLKWVVFLAWCVLNSPPGGPAGFCHEFHLYFATLQCFLPLCYYCHVLIPHLFKTPESVIIVAQVSILLALPTFDAFGCVCMFHSLLHFHASIRDQFFSAGKNFSNSCSVW